MFGPPSYCSGRAIQCVDNHLTSVLNLDLAYQHDIFPTSFFLHQYGFYNVQFEADAMILSDFLKSSLKIYKDDTDIIATWLAVTAKRCGYSSDLLDRTDPLSFSKPIPPQSSNRLKGKARKQARDAAAAQESRTTPSKATDNPPAKASYTIKVQDFTALAGYIASSSKPVIKVPGSVVETLNRAIELRSQHNSWFREQNASDKPIEEVKADENHSYFLGILERTLEILRPHMPSDMINDLLCEPLSELGVNEDPGEKTTSQIRNIFDSLDVQEPSQEFLARPGVSVPRSTTEHRYKAKVVHSLEEQYLAAHCLFQDLRNLRSFLRQLWASYRTGETNLVAASITTNTAIDFVRDIEQDYLQQFPDQSDYQGIVALFYKVQCASRGQHPNHRQQPGDLFNFAVYDLAEECLLSTYIILNSAQNVISPGNLPIYKAGHFGQRDLRRNWSQKSPRQKFKDDQLVLLEAFPDLLLMKTITLQSPLAEDALIRGFRDLQPGKGIPLWTVFATQCFLDT